MKVRWIGDAPEQCDLCRTPLLHEFYDVRLLNGSWANTCHRCWQVYGTGLGEGVGQHFIKVSDDCWVKNNE